nr:MAG: hypothetical protein [Bacteriophage sp.]
MSEIKITTEKVREAYKKGNDCVKGVLQNLFGEEVCAPKNVMDRVKTFEDACIETGTDIKAFNEMTKNLDEHVVTYMKLSIIVKALNEDDKFPYFTKEEWRYYPYFWLYTKDEYEKMNTKDREKVSRVLFRSCGGAYSGAVLRVGLRGTVLRGRMAVWVLGLFSEQENLHCMQGNNLLIYM